MNNPKSFKDIVVVTGSIGSGKSTACKILENHGAVVISADTLAREVVAPNSQVLEQIATVFGSHVLHADGTLNRSVMAQIVFTNPEKRKKLESITHPAIRKLSQKRFTEAIESGMKLIVYECPLYFETHLERQCSFGAVILITCKDSTALARVQSRDGTSKQEVQSRLEAQMDNEEKASRADHVIVNEGSLEDLESKLLKVINSLGFADNHS